MYKTHCKKKDVVSMLCSLRKHFDTPYHYCGTAFDNEITIKKVQ